MTRQGAQRLRVVGALESGPHGKERCAVSRGQRDEIDVDALEDSAGHVRYCGQRLGLLVGRERRVVYRHRGFEIGKLGHQAASLEKEISPVRLQRLERGLCLSERTVFVLLHFVHDREVEE